jgi:hypothetical protein
VIERSTRRAQPGQFLLGSDRPLTMAQRPRAALGATFAVVIVVVQLALGAWLLALFWAFVAALVIVNAVRDARRAEADGRLTW